MSYLEGPPHLELHTRSGYVIKLKRTKLLWGEKKIIKNILAQTLQISGVPLKDLEQSNGKALQDATVSLNLESNQLAQEKVFEMLTEYIQTPTGDRITTDFMKWLEKQDGDIGDEIFEAVNNATVEKPIKEEKKT